MLAACGYAEPDAISNAIGYAMHRSRSHAAVIRVYDDAGNVIETQVISEPRRNSVDVDSLTPRRLIQKNAA